jgi:hypothetical protein
MKLIIDAFALWGVVALFIAIWGLAEIARSKSPAKQ